MSERRVRQLLCLTLTATTGCLNTIYLPASHTMPVLDAAHSKFLVAHANGAADIDVAGAYGVSDNNAILVSGRRAVHGDFARGAAVQHWGVEAAYLRFASSDSTYRVFQFGAGIGRTKHRSGDYTISYQGVQGPDSARMGRLFTSFSAVHRMTSFDAGFSMRVTGVMALDRTGSIPKGLGNVFVEPAISFEVAAGNYRIGPQLSLTAPIARESRLVYSGGLLSIGIAHSTRGRDRPK